jgi:hypothetical protein
LTNFLFGKRCVLSVTASDMYSNAQGIPIIVISPQKAINIAMNRKAVICARSSSGNFLLMM